ncbi:MAG TPA: phosphatidylglycerophosphatase A [Opitutales bacterium]|nr:phosphatidylglycerophosphatase A [Opitutales bacterium]
MRWKQPLWLRLLPSPLVINLATLGPVGRVKRGPGTAGSAVGLIWFTLFFFRAGWFEYLLLGGLSVVVAIAICEEAEIRLQKRDPGEVVIDEFVAIPFCFLGLQPYLNEALAWLIILVGFLLFRVFDIAKPFGIRRLQKLEGGFGVVVDDLVAALATAFCLHLFVYFTPFWI